MKRFILALCFSAAAASAASAQAVEVPPSLDRAMRAGTAVWLTDSTGREQKTRVVAISESTVTTGSGDRFRTLRTDDIVQVTASEPDSVLNGALIGAGVAVASGLLLCTAMEPWENCRDDAGPMLRFAAVGAGIGMGIDALIRGQRTIYEAPDGSRRLDVSPFAGRGTRGLRLSLKF